MPGTEAPTPSVAQLSDTREESRRQSNGQGQLYAGMGYCAVGTIAIGAVALLAAIWTDGQYRSALGLVGIFGVAAGLLCFYVIGRLARTEQASSEAKPSPSPTKSPHATESTWGTVVVVLIIASFVTWAQNSQKRSTQTSHPERYQDLQPDEVQHGDWDSSKFDWRPPKLNSSGAYFEFAQAQQHFDRGELQLAEQLWKQALKHFDPRRDAEMVQLTNTKLSMIHAARQLKTKADAPH